jgi:hypothetical protein
MTSSWIHPHSHGCTRGKSEGKFIGGVHWGLSFQVSTYFHQAASCWAGQVWNWLLQLPKPAIKLKFILLSFSSKDSIGNVDWQVWWLTLSFQQSGLGNGGCILLPQQSCHRVGSQMITPRKKKAFVKIVMQIKTVLPILFK